jgi:hypothetical protein
MTDTTDTDPPFSPLLADIFTRMFEDSAFTTNALIEGLQRQVDDYRCELAAVREGVARLLGGPYQPSTDAIERAVFNPDPRLVAKHRDPATD